MNILGAIRREEKKVKKQLAKLQHDLIGLQSAAKALGKSANRDFTTAKKHVLSLRSESKDFKSYQAALGKAQSASKEGCRLIVTQRGACLTLESNCQAV